MYAIACILSYDGLPSMVPVDESMEPQTSKAGGADMMQGRRAIGYISPGKFLRSLTSDQVQNKSNFHKMRASMHGNAILTYPAPHALADRFQQQRPPFGPGSGGSAPRIRSTKRQRENGSR